MPATGVAANDGNVAQVTDVSLHVDVHRTIEVKTGPGACDVQLRFRIRVAEVMVAFAGIALRSKLSRPYQRPFEHPSTIAVFVP